MVIFQNSLAMDALESNGGPADIAEIEQIVKEKMVRLAIVACCVHGLTMPEKY